MQRVTVGEALDGADFLAGRLRGEHEARPHRHAVDNDSARAADAVFTADMGAGLSAILTDRVRQDAPRLNCDGMIAAIDRQRDVGLAIHCRSLVRSSPRLRGSRTDISILD